MPLPTDAEIRQAFVTLGQLAAAGSYYNGLPSGTTVLSDTEKTAMTGALQYLSRANITPLESVDRTTQLPSTPFFTATRQGVYLVVGYFLLTTSASAGTATFGLAWNDGRLAQSENQLTNVPITGTGQKSFTKAVVLGAGQSISANVALNGVTGAPVYSVYARIIEL
jgi:hypothetical protein